MSGQLAANKRVKRILDRVAAAGAYHVGDVLLLAGEYSLGRADLQQELKDLLNINEAE